MLRRGGVLVGKAAVHAKDLRGGVEAHASSITRAWWLRGRGYGRTAGCCCARDVRAPPALCPRGLRQSARWLAEWST